MIQAIEAAFYEGKLLCAFFTRDECKEYIRKNLPDIDPFEVQLKTQYVSDYKQPTGYFDR